VSVLVFVVVSPQKQLLTHGGVGQHQAAPKLAFEGVVGSVQVDKYSLFCHESGPHLRLILGAGVTITKLVYMFSTFLSIFLRLGLC
jgi:hypothetical protein